MRTVLLEPLRPEFAALLDRRRATGLDLFDEVWRGELHVAPAPRRRHGIAAEEVAAVLRGPARTAGLRLSGPFNLGGPDDYRVPDLGLHRADEQGDDVWVHTAAAVVEVVPPGDETFEKFDFFFGCGVEEVLVVDFDARSVRLWARGSTSFVEVERSGLLGLNTAGIVEAIDWP